MAFAVFEHVEGADQVVLDELAAAGAAGHAGQHAGVGGGVDDPVHLRQGLEVAGVTDIPVEKPDPLILQDVRGSARCRAG